MPTMETEKFIRTLLALHEYAPEKPLPEVIETAKTMMGLTARQRERERKPRVRKVEPAKDAA